MTTTDVQKPIIKLLAWDHFQVREVPGNIEDDARRLDFFGLGQSSLAARHHDASRVDVLTHLGLTDEGRQGWKRVFTDHIDAIDTGKITKAELADLIFDAAGTQSRFTDREEFADAFLNFEADLPRRVLDPRLEILIATARSHGIPSMLASNVSLELRDQVARDPRVYGRFSPEELVLSCDPDVQLRKPTPEFYELLIDRAQVLVPGIKAEEILFTDDSAKNTAAAGVTGLHAITYTGYAAWMREAQRFLPRPLLAEIESEVRRLPKLSDEFLLTSNSSQLPAVLDNGLDH